MKQHCNTPALILRRQTVKQMTKQVFLACVMAFCVTTLQAQETAPAQKGNAILQVFCNFHSGFGADNADRGFELQRSYLGYAYTITKGLSIKGVLNVGRSSDVSDYHHIAYIKHAMLTWQTGRLKLSAGLINTTQFHLQEKFWGHRYIRKSFQDQYKFGSSADLGISAAYQFNSWLAADAIVVNGEGYKKIQVADGLNYGLGITLTPLKGCFARVYGGLNEASQDGQKDIVNAAVFLGYKNRFLSVGAEYNYIRNATHEEYVRKSGLSIYATGKVSKAVGLIARFDHLTSDAGDGESVLLVGVQTQLGKYVKLSPYFLMADPKSDGAKSRYYAYVSCCFGL